MLPQSPKLNSVSFSYPHSSFSSRWRVPRQVIHFGENLGDVVKGHSLKKLKNLIEVPNVSQRGSTCSNLQYDPYLISVARSYPSYPFR